MKNWKFTAAVVATAAATAVLAIFNSQAQQGGDDAGAAKAPDAAAAPESPDKAWDFLPDVVATYGDRSISKADFIRTVTEILASSPMPSNSPDPAMLKSIAPKIVGTMIDKQILLDEAGKSGLKPSADLVISEFDEMVKSAPPEKFAQFKESLESRGTSVDEYKRKTAENRVAQEDAAITVWIKRELEPQVKIGDEDTRKYFDEHQAIFTRPETLSASHILIKPEDDTPEKDADAKKKCEQIKKDIGEGKCTFEDAAVQNSDCPSGKRAKGSLGDFRHGEMVKEFDEAASAMKIGEMGGPVKTEFGYHLIRLDGKKEKGVDSFDDVKGQIREYLAGEQTDKLIKDFISRKKNDLNIKLNI